MLTEFSSCSHPLSWAIYAPFPSTMLHFDDRTKHAKFINFYAMLSHNQIVVWHKNKDCISDDVLFPIFIFHTFLSACYTILD